MKKIKEFIMKQKILHINQNSYILRHFNSKFMSRRRNQIATKTTLQLDLAPDEKRTTYSLKVAPIGVKIGAASNQRTARVQQQLESMRLAVRGVQATPTVIFSKKKKERKPRGPPELNLIVDMMAPVRHADSPVSMDASHGDGAISVAIRRESNPGTVRDTDNGSSLIDGQHLYVEQTHQEAGETELRPAETLSKLQTSQLPSVLTQVVRGMPQSPTTTDPLPWSPVHANPGQQLPSDANPFQNTNDNPIMANTSPSFADAAAAGVAQQNQSYQGESAPRSNGVKQTLNISQSPNENENEQPPNTVEFRDVSGISDNDVGHLLQLNECSITQTRERSAEQTEIAVEEEEAGEPRKKADQDELRIADQKAAVVVDGNHTPAHERQADKAKLMLIEQAHESLVEEERQRSPRSQMSPAQQVLQERIRSLECDFMNTAEMFAEHLESERSSREGDQSQVDQLCRISNDQPKYYTLQNRPFVIIDDNNYNTLNATIKHDPTTKGSAGGQGGPFETGSSDAYNASFSSISPRRHKFSNLKPSGIIIKADVPRTRKNNQGTNTNSSINAKAMQQKPKLAIVQPQEARILNRVDPKAFLPQLQQRALRARSKLKEGMKQNRSKSPDETRGQNHSQYSELSEQIRDLIGVGGLIEHKNPVNQQPNRITPKQVELAQMLNLDLNSSWQLEAGNQHEVQYNKQVQDMEEVINRRQVLLDHKHSGTFLNIPNLTSRAGSSHNPKGSRAMIATLASAEKTEIIQVDQVQEYEDAINDVVNCIKKIENKQIDQKQSERNQIGAKNMQRLQQYSQNSFLASFGKHSRPPNKAFGGPTGSIGSINTLQLARDDSIRQSSGIDTAILNVKSEEREFANTVSVHQLKQQLSHIRNNSTVHESNQQFAAVRPTDKASYSLNKTYQGFPSQFKPKEADYNTSRNYFKAETNSTVMTPNVRDSTNSTAKKQGNQLSLGLGFSNSRQSQIYIQNQQDGMKAVQSLLQAPKPSRRPTQLPRQISMFKGESADKKLTITQILGIGSDRHNLKKIKKPMTMLEHSMKLSKQLESKTVKQQLSKPVKDPAQLNSPKVQERPAPSSPNHRAWNHGDDSVHTQYQSADRLSQHSAKEEPTTKTMQEQDICRINIVLREQINNSKQQPINSPNSPTSGNANARDLQNSQRAFQFFKTMESSNREEVNDVGLLNSQRDSHKEKVGGKTKRKLLLKLDENKKSEAMGLLASVDSMPDSLGSIGSLESPSDGGNDYVNIREAVNEEFQNTNYRTNDLKKASMPLENESADQFHSNTADYTTRYVQTLKNSQGIVSPTRVVGEYSSNSCAASPAKITQMHSLITARARVPDETMDEVLTGGEVSQKSSRRHMRATLQEKSVGNQLTKQSEMNPSTVIYRFDPQTQIRTKFQLQSLQTASQTARMATQPSRIGQNTIPEPKNINPSHSRAFSNNMKQNSAQGRGQIRIKNFKQSQEIQEGMRLSITNTNTRNVTLNTFGDKSMTNKSQSYITEGKMSAVRNSIISKQSMLRDFQTLKESNLDLLTQAQNLQQQTTSIRIQARTKRPTRKTEAGSSNTKNEEWKELQKKNVPMSPSFLKNFPSTLSISHHDVQAEVNHQLNVHRNSSLPDSMTLNKQMKKYQQYQDSAMLLKLNDSRSSRAGRKEKDLLRIQEIQHLTQRRVTKGNAQMAAPMERVRSIDQNLSSKRRAVLNRDLATAEGIGYHFDRVNLRPIDTKRSKLEKIKMAGRDQLTQRVAGQSGRSTLHSAIAFPGLPELKRGSDNRKQFQGQSSPQSVNMQYVKPLSNMPFGSQQNSGVVCIGQHMNAQTQLQAQQVYHAFRLDPNATSPRDARKLREIGIREEQVPSSVKVCLPLQIRERIPSHLGTGANPSQDDGTGTTGNATGYQSPELITEPMN